MPSEIVSPRWREEVVLWAGRAPGFRAWRQHDALQSKFHPEHADDIPVFFRDAASGRDEQMWVHVIGYDRPSDEYLGILINTPDLVSSIQAGDNVAFRNVDWAEYPWALSVGGSYRQAGLPACAPSELLEITAADRLRAVPVEGEVRDDPTGRFSDAVRPRFDQEVPRLR